MTQEQRKGLLPTAVEVVITTDTVDRFVRVQYLFQLLMFFATMHYDKTTLAHWQQVQESVNTFLSPQEKEDIQNGYSEATNYLKKVEEVLGTPFLVTESKAA